MIVNTNKIRSIDKEMDAKYGKVGTPEREEFRREAYAWYMSQILQDARKTEKITQQELANRVGVNKSYISKIENGYVEPGIGTYYRIASALGRSVELTPA